MHSSIAANSKVNSIYAKHLAVVLILLFLGKGIQAQSLEIKNDSKIIQILSGKDELLSKALKDYKKFHFQIIYTQIERNGKNKPKLTNYGFNVDKQFYHLASLIKLPLAVVVLEKLTQLKSKGVSLDDSISVLTGTCSKELINYLASFKRPTIRLVMKDMFIVSDNNAYNLFYDLCGLDDFNTRMKELGLENTLLLNRFASCSPEGNRTTNTVQLFNTDSKKLTYTFESKTAKTDWKLNPKLPHEFGKKHLEGGKKVKGPKSFLLNNYAPLSQLHKLLSWIIFPQLETSSKKLNIAPEYREELIRMMGILPSESKDPIYLANKWPDDGMKYFIADKSYNYNPENIRFIDKVGQASGFMSDCAYIIDTVNNIEFMLSAAVYSDLDGVAADGKYNYDEFAFPVLRKIGKLFYQEELKHRKNQKINSPINRSFAD